MRAKFEDRAALLLDRFNMTSDAYRNTMSYHRQRNSIAHGRTLATGIDVPFVIRDFHRIAGQIVV